MIKTIKIGYRRYPIQKWDKPNADAAEALGLIDKNEGIIRIKEGRTPADTAETLLHEILHALLHDSGIEWDKKDEESFVSKLTPRLAAFFADNPKQVKELTAMLSLS